jgi:hypothetical protein
MQKPQTKTRPLQGTAHSAFDNNYIEGCANTLHVCGQTVRNNLKKQDPQHLLEVNQQIIKEMKKKGALSKQLILAVDWHDEMYYGNQPQKT